LLQDIPSGKLVEKQESIFPDSVIMKDVKKIFKKKNKLFLKKKKRKEIKMNI
jgi:hypothetical protein